jgi:hypothetical protein
MDATQPLRDVFAGLAGTGDAGEPATVLAASGHDDLPDGLIAEAVVSYADTAPVEVAEHLAPFVRAHSAVPGPATDPPSWLTAVGTAPVDVDPVGLDATTEERGLDDGAAAPDGPILPSEPPGDVDDHFGHGDTSLTGHDGAEARWAAADAGGDPGAVPDADLSSPQATVTADSADLGYLGDAPTGDDLDADPADLDDLG